MRWLDNTKNVKIQLFLTNIVVTVSVLLASVSDAFRSRDVEFMTNVLLENQVPICQNTKKRGKQSELSDQ